MPIPYTLHSLQIISESIWRIPMLNMEYYTITVSISSVFIEVSKKFVLKKSKNMQL